MYAVIVIMALLVGLVLFVFLISKDTYDDIEDIKDDIEGIKDDIDELNDKLDRIIRKLNKTTGK